MSYLQQGSGPFVRASVALVASSFVAFATLYSTQPLLPTLAQDFGVSPTEASLSLSVATGALAVSLLPAVAVSDAFGRKPVLAGSILVAAVLMLAAAASPTYGLLVIVRAIQGLAVGGLTTASVAYIGEEVHPASLGLAMGLLISGNTLGGMSGRIFTGVLTDAFTWRGALGTIGVVSLLLAIGFWVMLPSSRRFEPRRQNPAATAARLARHLRDPGLQHLYAISFLLMGAWVATFNYVTFLLVGPPYSLSQATVGWVFLVYVVGVFSSTWMGRLGDRLGRRRVLWVGVAIQAVGALTTLQESLAAIILGLAIFTFGFFGGHSTASSWVARRATTDRSLASALYLLFYYLGSSVLGSVAGPFWSGLGWPGVVALVIALLAAALVLSFRLTAIPPLVPVGAEGTGG